MGGGNGSQTSRPKEIWVFVEQDHGEISESSREVLSEGSHVANQGEARLIALALGSAPLNLGGELSKWGVDQFHFAQTLGYSRYVPGLYTRTVVSLFHRTNPSLFLLAGTSTGNDLAPRVAARLGTTCATNGFSLDIEESTGAWLVWRKVYNGHGDAQMRVSGTPAVVTLQLSDFNRREVGKPRAPEVAVHTFEPPSTEMLVELISRVPPQSKSMSLDQAEVIVVGGNGVGSKEGFEMLWQLADLLGGTVGCTRAVVDQHWLPRDRLIGQTGATVNPKLLISCGVSGAIQHTLGLRDTRFLIAINLDRSAPILRLADLGIVGDMHQILPPLIEAIRHVRTHCLS